MKKSRTVHSDIVRDSMNTFGTNVIRAVLGFVSAFVVLRRINPEIKGLFNQVQTWGGGLNTVLGLSVTAAVIYFVARYTVKNAKNAVLKLCAVLAAGMVVIGGAVVLVLRGSSFFSSTPSQYLAAIVVYALLSLILGVCMSVLRGENKFKSYNIVNLTQQILVTALAVAVAVRPSAALWVWATNGIVLLMIVFSLYCVVRWNGPKPVPAQEDDLPVGVGSVTAYSLKSHVSNVLTYLNSNLGNYIVQGKYALGDFGVYNTAFTMMQQVWILPDAVSQVIMSRIASMKVQKDKVKLTLISAKVVTYATVVIAFLLVLVADLFVPMLFPMYTGALAPLKYLIVGSIFISYAKVLGNSIAAYGRPELNIVPTFLGVAVNCLFSLFLIPAMGINGVALATSLSLTVQGLSNAVIFCRLSGTAFYRLLIPSREELGTLKGILKK